MSGSIVEPPEAATTPSFVTLTSEARASAIAASSSPASSKAWPAVPCSQDWRWNPSIACSALFTSGSARRARASETSPTWVGGAEASRPQTSHSLSAHHLSSAGTQSLSTSQLTILRANGNSCPAAVCASFSLSCEPSENSTTASFQ